MGKKLDPDRMIFMTHNVFPTQLCFAATPKAWKDWIKGEKLPPEPYPSAAGQVTTWHKHHKDGGNSMACVVTFAARADEVSPTEMLGMIAHEVTHLVQKVKQDIGEKKWGVETEAYMHQFLFQQILLAFRDTRPKSRLSKALRKGKHNG